MAYGVSIFPSCLIIMVFFGMVYYLTNQIELQEEAVM
jgi:hypothetical protein